MPEGAPADFILIGATTREPEDIDPAIRSRCAEVFFEPLTEAQIREIVTGAATRLGARVTKGVADTIASYTIEGRKAVQILADAHGQALYRLGRATGVRDHARPTLSTSSRRAGSFRIRRCARAPCARSARRSGSAWRITSAA